MNTELILLIIITMFLIAHTCINMWALLKMKEIWE